MVRQFQESYFDSRYQSTMWGYSAPDFAKVAEAYGIKSATISKESELGDGITALMQDEQQPFLLQVMVDSSANAYPKIAFGKPMTEMEPMATPIAMESTFTRVDLCMILASTRTAARPRLETGSALLMRVTDTRAVRTWCSWTDTRRRLRKARSFGTRTSTFVEPAAIGLTATSYLGAARTLTRPVLQVRKAPGHMAGRFSLELKVGG